MALRIEDYALIGNMHTAALVGRNGSIDWLCVPRFDSGACFAALLGTPENGRWLIAPRGEIRSSHRAYRADTLVLETVFETADGTVALVDFMPISERPGQVDVIRLVQGRGGAVPMRMELVLRFDYGHVVPWVRRFEDGVRAIGGPDAVLLQSPVVTEGRDLKPGFPFSKWSSNSVECSKSLDRQGFRCDRGGAEVAWRWVNGKRNPLSSRSMVG